MAGYSSTAPYHNTLVWWSQLYTQMILFQLGYPKAAEDRFRRELLRDSDCPLAQLGVAQLAALQGDWDSAISGIEQLGRSYPRELNRLL